MKESNNVNEILNKIEKNKTKNNYWGWFILAVLVLLAVAFILKLYRLPFGIGMGIIILLVLVKWGIPSFYNTLKENRRIRNENEILRNAVKKMQQQK